MLIGISIRNMVLIDRLDIEVGPGLSVLTGETGAGKSILLDALGMAAGARADTALIRKGCDQAVAIAEFSLPKNHPALQLLSEQGIESEGALILRRLIGRDGRSRAFANDQAVSVGLLRLLGEMLVEVHGQHDDRGLLNPASHRALLDAFAGLGDCVSDCREAFRKMGQAQETVRQARSDLQQAQTEENYLRHVVNELDQLAPRPGEEAELTSARALMMNSEKLAEEINAAMLALSGGAGDGAGDGAESQLGAAFRGLERVAQKALGKLDAALCAVSRALSETMEARAQLELMVAELEFDPRRLEEIESRLFALRDAARKHHIPVDDLPLLRGRMADKLLLLDAGAGRLEELQRHEEKTRAAYESIAARLSKARLAAAQKLDGGVAKELPPLKLDKSSFRTQVRPGPAADGGSEGVDRVEFLVATNPGADPGSLGKIASGGELSRFTLALRVVLAKSANAGTIVFDEVDSAVGGAIADAIGDRLSKLANDAQILVVTHSPQVAARAGNHWRVSKKLTSGGVASTVIEALDAPERREEIARMLAGAKITDAARAAADSLMATGRR